MEEPIWLRGTRGKVICGLGALWAFGIGFLLLIHF
jgi:hypothetical protein